MRLYFSLIICFLLLAPLSLANCEFVDYNGQEIMECPLAEGLSVMGIDLLYLEEEDGTKVVRFTGDPPAIVDFANYDTEIGLEIGMYNIQGEVNDDFEILGFTLADTEFLTYPLTNQTYFSYDLYSEKLDFIFTEENPNFLFEGMLISPGEEGSLSVSTNEDGNFVFFGNDFYLEEIKVVGENYFTFNEGMDLWYFENGGDFEYQGILLNTEQEIEIGYLNRDYLMEDFFNDIDDNGVNQFIYNGDSFITSGENIEISFDENNEFLPFDDETDRLEFKIESGKIFFESYENIGAEGEVEIKNGFYNVQLTEEGEVLTSLERSPDARYIYESGYDILPFTLSFVDETGEIDQINFIEGTDRTVDKMEIGNLDFYQGKEIEVDIIEQTESTDREITTALLEDSFDTSDAEDLDFFDQSCESLPSREICENSLTEESCYWSGIGCQECFPVLSCESYLDQSQCELDPCGFNTYEFQCTFTNSNCILGSYWNFSGRVDNVVEVGETFLGSPYAHKPINAEPEEGMDCSGFIHKAYDEAGYNMPGGKLHTAIMAEEDTMRPYFNSIPCENFQEGDVIVYRPPEYSEEEAQEARYTSCSRSSDCPAGYSCKALSEGSRLKFCNPRMGHTVMVKESYGNQGAIILHSKGGVGVTEDFALNLNGLYSPIGLEQKACWRHKQTG